MANKAKAIEKALDKSGLTEWAEIELTDNRRGIMVLHDYFGLYPTKDALNRCQAAQLIASRYKCKSEPRGHKTATLIYL